jgi:3-hydroxyisobutyrate dehydrogenase-like beta-hydroxyacid dehydrogenase
MLPMTQHVQTTLTGVDGVFQHCPKGSLIIDSSTIDPIASQALHTIAQEKGLKMLDAPVSGGVTGAAAGTLTFMVGGEETVVDAARVSLACILNIDAFGALLLYAIGSIASNGEEHRALWWCWCWR